jgi:hypothetical protein
MFGAYWRRVRLKAWGDTLHALSLDSAARVVARVLMALIAIGLFAYFAGPEIFQSRLMAVFASAAAFVAAFVLILLVNVLFITPAKLDGEAAARIKSLEEQLQQNLKQQSTKEERQAVIDADHCGSPRWQYDRALQDIVAHAI